MSQTVDVADQTGRTFVITGANSGLGLETARALVAAGGHVVLAVRDPQRGAEALAQVTPPGTKGTAEVRRLDLADLGSVREFAAGWEGPIAVLVNNAGIMMVPEGRTADGFERQIGTNHFGHFALTNLLLPKITDRVVTLSSELHNGPQVDLDNLDLNGSYRPSRAYQQSKLANLLFSAELQRKLTAAGSPVKSMAAHPGYSATNLQSHASSAVMRVVMAVANRLVATKPAAGAQPTLLATVGDLPGDTFTGPTGFARLRGAPGLSPRSKQAQDAQVAGRLWEISEQRTGVAFPL